jgi:hypothetical protein
MCDCARPDSRFGLIQLSLAPEILTSITYQVNTATSRHSCSYPFNPGQPSGSVTPRLLFAPDLLLSSSSPLGPPAVQHQPFLSFYARVIWLLRCRIFFLLETNECFAFAYLSVLKVPHLVINPSLPLVLRPDSIPKPHYSEEFVASNDSSSCPDAIMQRDEDPLETNSVPAGKRPKTQEEADISDGYEPESPRCGEARMSIFPSRMSLSNSTMNAYFMTNEYLAIKDKYNIEHIRRGWDLFRRLGYCEALASYTIPELQKGLEFITDSGILPFYERIHKDEIEKHNRRKIFYFLFSFYLYFFD